MQDAVEGHEPDDGGGTSDSATGSGLGGYEEVKAGVEAEAEKKLREVKTREMFDEQVHKKDDADGNTGVGLRRLDQAPAEPTSGSPPSSPDSSGNSEDQRLTSEVEQQKREDLKEKGDQIIVSSRPSTDFPSGILSIRIEQISGLGVQKVKETGVREAEEGEDDESDDLPSAYCTVLINHERVYKTRTKMKSSNPFVRLLANR